MKKIIAPAFIFFIVTVTSAFAQTDSTRVLEISDDFTEIKAIFQKRLYAASSEFKYFLHNDGPFDIENEYESQLFDAKVMEVIGKKKYFIFETTDTMTGSTAADDIYMYLLILVNKDGEKAAAFAFINDRAERAAPCSKAEIKRAFIATVSSTFREEDRCRIFECSNDFTEIKSAFRERLYDACLEKEYFYYEKDASGMGKHPLETNAQEIIDSIKTKYFIFKDEGAGVYFLYLVNKKDGKAIKFYFFDGGLESSKNSSQAEIDKALSLFLDL